MADELLSPDANLFPFENERFHTAYKNHSKGKRQNFFRAMTQFGELWDGLQLLNDICTREFSNLKQLREAKQMLPKALFASAHARFLTAIELGFSCCIGDAYSVLRDGIEAVAHAHKMLAEPAAASVWVNKHQGRQEEDAYKKIFEKNKKESLFPDKHGLRALHACYVKFSEMATHTSVTSLARSLEVFSTEANMRWVFHYFETDSQKLAVFLFALLQASFQMEEVFFACFETRQNLDPDLVTMRGQFQQVRKQQMCHLRETYSLDSI